MDPRLAIAEAMELRRRGGIDDAIALLTPLDRGASVEIAVARGALLAEARRLDEAVSCLRDAVARWPDNAAALYNLARAVRDAGDTAAAVALHEKLARAHPRLIPAWRSYGNCLVDLGHIDEAVAAYDRGTALRRAAATRDPRHPDYQSTTPAKLRHDLEQLHWLIGRGGNVARFEALLPAFERVCRAVSARAGGAQVVALEPDEIAALAPGYNLLLHVPVASRVAGGTLDPAVDWRAVARRYAENAPGITWIDGLLKPEVVATLRDYCLDATIWFRYRFAKGYVGAFWDDGFSAPLLLQVAEDLRRAAPTIFGRSLLRKAWAFKYDPELSGIPMHADFAAVNVNFWLTPDDANLDPESGGLVVWDKEAPVDWDFERYNTDEAAMRSFLAANGARSLRVPHRQNRAVVFNSDLFHETDRLSFRPGYANRRINVTLLYGRRGDAALPA